MKHFVISTLLGLSTIVAATACGDDDDDLIGDDCIVDCNNVLDECVDICDDDECIDDCNDANDDCVELCD